MLDSKQLWNQRNFGFKKCWVQEMWHTKIDMKKSKKIWVKRSFVQKNIGPQRLRPPQNWVPKVTAETLLIWTNVARTYVAQTNVTMTVGIC